MSQNFDIDIKVKKAIINSFLNSRPIRLIHVSLDRDKYDLS